MADLVNVMTRDTAQQLKMWASFPATIYRHFMTFYDILDRLPFFDFSDQRKKTRNIFAVSFDCRRIVTSAVILYLPGGKRQVASLFQTRCAFSQPCIQTVYVETFVSVIFCEKSISQSES